MTGDPLVFLPLPVLSALLCGAIAVMVRRLDLGDSRAPLFLSALFATFSVQAFLLGLRFGYGFDGLVTVQRVLPLLAGPLLYLGFTALTVEPGALRPVALRHLGVAGALAVLFVLPRWVGGWLDLVIGGSYLFYAALLIAMWRRGPDGLTRARFDVAGAALRWMLWGAGLLLVLLVLDTLIALSFALERAGRATTIISYASVPMLALLLAVILGLPRFLRARPAPMRPAVPDDDSAAMEQAAAKMLRETRLFLDPALSVQRLARRLHVPERALSGAINQATGLNVSQYVNGFRVAHAADLLRSGDDSVAQVMAQSGFLTRSNFYREFQRVHGQTPAAYRRGD